MRPDLETYYLIDQYLENNLKGEELIAFEKQLSQDASFAKEVAEQRMLNNFILEAELKDVRNQIGKDLADIQKPSFFRMNWQWIGLGILSISSIIYFSISSKNETNKPTQQSVLSTTEYAAPSVSGITKSEENSNNTATITKSKNQSANTVSDIQQLEPTTVAIDNSVHAIENKEAVAPIAHTPHIDHVAAIETKSTEEAHKLDCSLIKIAFSLTTETSCGNSETGAIHIDKISGGNTPYSFALNNKKIKEKNISDLGAGTYEVKISDKNGCFATHTATILEKNCTPAIQQGAKFNINPTIGETCNIPFNTDKKGNITIYSRSGKIVQRVQNPSSEYVEWNGTDGYGALTEAGLYVYVIEYTDGTKVTGEVNIIR